MGAIEVLLLRAARDARIIVATKRAINAMQLVNGGRIEIEGLRGRLNLGGEINGLEEVLEILIGEASVT
jgi:hypothetical protein